MSEIGAQYPKMKFLGVGKTTSHPIKYYYKASLIRKVAPAAKATKAAKPAKSAKAVKGTKKTSKKAK